MTYIDILRLTDIRTITLITHPAALHAAIVDQVAHRVRQALPVSVHQAGVKVKRERYNDSMTTFFSYISLYKKLYIYFFLIYDPFYFRHFVIKKSKVLIINKLKHDDFDYFRHGYDEVRHKTEKATLRR